MTLLGAISALDYNATSLAHCWSACIALAIKPRSTDVAKRGQPRSTGFRHHRHRPCLYPRPRWNRNTYGIAQPAMTW